MIPSDPVLQHYPARPEDVNSESRGRRGALPLLRVPVERMKERARRVGYGRICRAG
jgi:hypothetical protein